MCLNEEVLSRAFFALLVTLVAFAACKAAPCREGFLRDAQGNCRAWNEEEDRETGEETVETGSDEEPYHPEEFSDPDQHSVQAKFHEDDCKACHGTNLDGGSSGVSCDQCHVEGWREDCTFCHGGDDNETGAPPQDLSGEPVALSFLAHSKHIAGEIHESYDCVQCHQKPTDVLSEGHLFDATAGEAEVDFSGGISGEGVYAGGGSCSNLYCHGNALDQLGSYSHDSDPPTCNSCHPGPEASHLEYEGMGGQHLLHVDRQVHCSECHADTIDINNNLVGTGVHVNGTVNLTITQLDFNGTTCTGECHQRGHENETW